MAVSGPFIAAGITAAAAVGSAAVSANQSSIANKRRKNAAAAQLAALEALEAEPTPALPDDDAINRQRRRSISRQLGRGGRQSTILTTPETRAGLGG